MSNARNLANVISGNYDIPAGSLDNAVPADGSITAPKLASGAAASNLGSYVTSVNGQTGAVTLSTGGVTSLNGQTGAITNTNLYAIGAYINGRPPNSNIAYSVNTTIAGSSLYSICPSGQWSYNSSAFTALAMASFVNVGTWRCVSGAYGSGTGSSAYGYAGLWVRIS